MNAAMNGTVQDSDKTRMWYRTAVATAAVAAMFCLAITVFMALNFYKLHVLGPRRENELEALKTKLRSRDDDEKLVEQIRQMDLSIRRTTVRGKDFSVRGGYLLFGSAVVFLVGAKYAGSLRKRMPGPQVSADQRQEQLRQAQRSRWAVTALVLVLGSGAVLLALTPVVNFSGTSAEVRPYPSEEEIQANWPCFRGPAGSGVSAYANVPSKWDPNTGEGILWKSKVPLPGHNSPIVWGDRVFVSGATKDTREVYCYDALSGALLWTGTVAGSAPKDAEPLEIMEDTGYAAPTMATDGRRTYALFPTGDVGCFDFDGKQVWARNLGIPDSPYGYASSLAIYRNFLLIQYDQGGIEDEKSKVIALDVFSGRTLWETKRPVGSSWASPIVARIDGEYQFITCADPWVIAYDPTNGAELWRVKCLSGDVAPSPIYSGGFVFAIEPYMRLVAIKPQGRGDITETGITWGVEDPAPDICSPVSNGELVYMLTTEGFLCCYQASDGSRVFEKELEMMFLASPSIADDRMYLLSRKGVMLISEVGPEYKELARCALGEKCLASPAFADGRIYIRAVEHLYCIGEPSPGEPVQDTDG